MTEPPIKEPMWHSRIVQWLAHRRGSVQIVLDVAAWGVAVFFATIMRYDFNHLGDLNWGGLLAIGPIAGLSQFVAGLVFGLYLGRWRFGSFDEVLGVARAAALATGILFIANLWLNELVPLTAPVSGGVAALVLMAASRYLWRLMLESRRRPTDATAKRMIVFGAGDGAAQIMSQMLRDPHSPYLPVALLDDDIRKRNLRISNVRVLGGRSQLAAVSKATEAEVLLIAIPSAHADLVAEINDLATEVGLDTKVLPPVGELFNGLVAVSDIRDVTVADLLGRHEIVTDVEGIADYLTAKRVLVTGAGGSIGSELCRQIYRFAPEELIMVDRDESALHAVQLSMEGRALLDSPNLVLLDIRDRDRLLQVFDSRRPHVVFHAAALKHLPLLEQHPGEAVKSNVWGTLQVLEASAAAGVERFVNISTDKAADPISVLGYSKRIAERLTAWFAARHDGVYLSVRFGNVLASRGSVLETFHAQIEGGGPVTVTHPDVTRYFMTIPEAVELVIQAGAIGRDGEALVLDMGHPVRILDVAKRLVAKAERQIKIVYTGLRPGEKLHEHLLGAGEPDHRPVHPLISHVPVPALDPAEVMDLGLGGSAEAVNRELQMHCDIDGRRSSAELES
jgi:FlaA1/EpsC-like NDP-sugar epimerase